MTSSLVGSEMCIRDRVDGDDGPPRPGTDKTCFKSIANSRQGGNGDVEPPRPGTEKSSANSRLSYLDGDDGTF
eukprot:39214-Prorocentrum_lima.AAC.1